MKKKKSRSLLDDIVIRFSAKYIQGDERISGKIEGLLIFNQELNRLEFLITPSKDRTIIISYPMQELKRIEIIPMGLSKKRHLKLVFNEEKGIVPIFRIKDQEIDEFVEKITEFREQAIKKPKDQDKGVKPPANPITHMVSLLGGVVKGAVETVTKTIDQGKDVVLNIFNPKAAPIPLSYNMMTLDGIKCVYLDSREQIEPQNTSVVVIALHPIGGAMSVLEPILSRLDIHQYGVLTHELRGHGMTIGDGGNFHLEAYVNDLKHFLDAMLAVQPQKEKPIQASNRDVIFVTHSLSTVIVLEYLLRQGQKKDTLDKSITYHLIMMASGHAAPEELRKGVNKLPPVQLWRPFKRIIVSKAKELLVHPKNVHVAEEFLTHCVNIPDKVFYQVFKSFLPQYHYDRIGEWIQSRKSIHNVLILRGDHDQLFSSELYDLTNDFFKQLSHEMTLNYYNALTIPTAGHLLPLEQPEVVAKHIDNFIKQHVMQGSNEQ